MNVHGLTVEYGECAKGVFTVTLNNIRFHYHSEEMLSEIITQFVENQNLCFELYRTDGLNLSTKDERRLRLEIPRFFRTNGEIIRSNKYLSYARAKLKDCLRCNFFMQIFDYYLDTVVFYSNSDIRSFAEATRNSLPERCEHYFENSSTNVLFHYFDSGDFAILFRASHYSSIFVEKQIERIIQKYSVV